MAFFFNFAEPSSFINNVRESDFCKDSIIIFEMCNFLTSGLSKCSFLRHENISEPILEVGLLYLYFISFIN
jgi:hypothetical protein